MSAYLRCVRSSRCWPWRLRRRSRRSARRRAVRRGDLSRGIAGPPPSRRQRRVRRALQAGGAPLGYALRDLPQGDGADRSRLARGGFELSFTQGRWDTPRWGRAPLGHRPIGAELWASFHTPDSPDVDVEAATDTSWNNLTSLLGGQLCASLGRLDRAEIVVAPKLAFHPWDGTASAVVSDRPRRHGSLPAEAVCTENLTPWLKFLPCRDQSGVASLLRSRTTLFGSSTSRLTRTSSRRADRTIERGHGVDPEPDRGARSATGADAHQPGDALRVGRRRWGGGRARRRRRASRTRNSARTRPSRRRPTSPANPARTPPSSTAASARWPTSPYARGISPR